MAFTSSILVEGYASNNTNTTVRSIKEMTINENESCLYRMLEFNDKIHCIDISDKIAYYRALVESANGDHSNLSRIHEGYVTGWIKKLASMLEALIDYITNKLASMFEINSLIQMKFNQEKKKSKNFTLNIKEMGKEYSFTIFNYPNFQNISNKLCDEPLQDIFDDIETICNGTDLPEATDTTLKLAFSKLAKAIDSAVKSDGSCRVKNEYNGRREDSETFRRFISSNIIFRDRERMPYYKWRELSDNIQDISRNAINDKMSYINNRLETIKNRIEKLETADELQRKNLSTYFGQAKSIIMAYEWFLESIMNSRRAQMQDILRIYRKITDNNESLDESASIHGEEFTSDTLFDNEDIRDFNRTEWLDLKLESECYALKFDMMEEYRKAALAEAMIRTDESGSYQQLLELNQQTIEKVKVVIDQTIKNIINFFDQLIAKILDKFSPEAAYINKNMDVIKNKFKIKITSSAELIAGINRVRDPIDPKPYDYEKMKGDLLNEKTFFTKYILPDLERSPIRSRRNIKFDDNISIAQYLSAYYGLYINGVEPEKIEYDANTLEASKNNIITYVKQPNTVMAGIRASLSKLEIAAKRAAAEMNKPATYSAPKQIPAPVSTANNESAYSYLYDKWFNEADAELLDKDGNKVADVEGGASAAESEVLKRYINCYRIVYQTKLNAAKFIISEFASIMHKHVESYTQTNTQTQGQTANQTAK